MYTNIKVRFAPSPTGPLHIGGARTALYNYLFAKKNKGKFILRIEDTDRKRYVSGAEDYIKNALDWLELKTDENPYICGPSIFYRQSERNHIYQEKIKILLDKELAYYAFDTEEELQDMRNNLINAKVLSPKYNFVTRKMMKNSLCLSTEKVKELIEAKVPYVIRLKTNPKEDIRFYDKIRGWIKFSGEELEDKVLIKSDGIPTYHFANVVDDYLMQITHVIRGEEWLSSTPMHIFLYKSFGWNDNIPEFVHLPLLLKPSGEGKLSKRDGEAFGFPVYPIEWIDENGISIKGFREFGYEKNALLNFLAFLGWNPGNGKEIIKLEEMIESFSIEKIGKSGTKFDIKKAIWINSQHLKFSFDEIFQEISQDLNIKKLKYEKDFLKNILEDLIKKNNFRFEIKNEINQYLETPKYEKNFFEKLEKEEILNLKNILQEIISILKTDSFFDIKEMIENLCQKYQIKNSKLIPIFRYAICCKEKGLDLSKLFNFLGKNEFLKRIESFNFFFLNHE